MAVTDTPRVDPPGPTLLDGLSLLTQVADELVLSTVRDTHTAVADRVHAITRRTVPGGCVEAMAHDRIAGAVYGGLGLGLRGMSRGLDRAAAVVDTPRIEATPQGRLVHAAVNGLVGDRLLDERPQMAIPMAVRVDGRDVWPDAESLAAAYPSATGRVVVLLHGLCEDEMLWDLHRDRTGTTYPAALAQLGWTPVLLRANTGLPLRENGVALTALLDRLVRAWPVPVEQIALVGHSMGGLILRAASAVASRTPGDGPAWSERVSDVVTLGTPHLGAPLAKHVGQGSRGLGRLRETAAFGRILDLRSQGVHDLVAGLTDDVPPLPHARYHLVAATVSASSRHPAGAVLGDLLVRPASAYGRDRQGRELFPGADVLHVGGTDHWGLVNHPDVLAALRDWLA